MSFGTQPASQIRPEQLPDSLIAESSTAESPPSRRILSESASTPAPPLPEGARSSEVSGAVASSGRGGNRLSTAHAQTAPNRAETSQHAGPCVAISLRLTIAGQAQLQARPGLPREQSIPTTRHGSNFPKEEESSRPQPPLPLPRSPHTISYGH